MTTMREATMREAAESRRAPVRRRVATNIADEVREQIVSGRVRAGAFLGREPELMERYGVSRASLREALRLLEADGLVRVRRGPGGGVFAERPGHGTVAGSLEAHLRLRGADQADIADALGLLGSLRGDASHQSNVTLALLADVLAEMTGPLPEPDRRLDAA